MTRWPFPFSATLRCYTKSRDMTRDTEVDLRAAGDRATGSGGTPGSQLSRGGSDPVNNAEPLRGQGTGAAGGYGTGSDVGSSGGSQERTNGSGSDVGPETEWLRGAPGAGATSRVSEAALDVTPNGQRRPRRPAASR
jgi:hypothetical protein